MKGYKAFDKDLKCRDFQFEVGKEHTHNGEIGICEAGFHFCQKCADVFTFYPFQSGTRVCEIEAVGRIINGDEKCVTDKIHIVRELDWGEVLYLCNSGDRNSGNWNSGNRNSGNCNSGDRNSGDCNSGNWNSGNCNSGDCNSGDRNSGYRNSGDRNSGNWNSGDRNSGYLNTTEPKVRIFDAETEIPRTAIVFPDFFFFELCEWVEAKDMTDEEQKEHPSWQVTGGYLKTYEYKEAWHRSFDKAKSGESWEMEKAKLLALPNFDFKKFEIISGITKDEILG